MSMLKTNVSARFNKAVQFEKAHDYEQALREYLSILTVDPDFRDAYINLGSLYSRMNRLSDAMKFYKKALSLGQDYITLFNIGSIFYKMGRYAEALPNLKKSYTMNKAFVLSRLVTGLCLCRLHEFSVAEKHFLKVLETWPDNRVAMTALAIQYYNDGKFKQSLQFLDRLLEIDSDNIKIRGLKSDLLYKIGRIKESLVEIKIVNQKNDSFNYFDEFIKSIPVEIYTDKYGSMDEKIRALEKNCPEDSASLISLSLCHLLKGDTESAIQYLYKFKGTIQN